MKLNRICASAAALALVLSTGCSKPEDSASLTNENEAETAVTEKEGQSETQENTSAEENQSLLGGWQVNTSYSELLAETDRAVFDKALEGLTGAAYTPIQVIAKQTVSGTNYAFLCLETMVTGVPNANHAILTVYENTEGAVEILNIKALDLTDLPVIAENQTKYDILSLPFRPKDTVLQPSEKFIPFVRCCFLFCHIASSFFAGESSQHILFHNTDQISDSKVKLQNQKQCKTDLTKAATTPYAFSFAVIAVFSHLFCKSPAL